MVCPWADDLTIPYPGQKALARMVTDGAATARVMALIARTLVIKPSKAA
jgi:hypothetical protein